MPAMSSESVVVLLIDDQPFIGELVRRLIGSDSSIELFSCHQPRDAAALARQLAPDVILLDLVMPDLDGLTLLSTLRADPQTADTRIIVLSGTDDTVARRQAADAGANGFLVKLPPRDVLISAIRGGAVAETSPPRTDETLDRRVLASLREATPDRPDFTDTLIDQFTQEAASVLEQMRAAVRALDADALRRASHRLKGTAQTIGGNRLAALSAQMEGHAGRTLRGAVVAVLMTEIDQAFRDLQDALTSEHSRAGRR